MGPEALVPIEFQDSLDTFCKRIDKLQKHEVTFSDDVLAAVDVAFA